MLTIILLVLIGSAIAYVSYDNLMPVTLHVGQYIIPDIPLFYVIVGSLLTGLILAYLINILPSISSAFTLLGKDKEIKKNKDEVMELTKRVHQLELENEKLKHAPKKEPADRNAI